jgi:hypothetical protein
LYFAKPFLFQMLLVWPCRVSSRRQSTVRSALIGLSR